MKSPITTAAAIDETCEYISDQSEIAEIFDNQGESSNLDMYCQPVCVLYPNNILYAKPLRYFAAANICDLLVLDTIMFVETTLGDTLKFTT